MESKLEEFYNMYKDTTSEDRRLVIICTINNNIDNYVTNASLYDFNYADDDLNVCEFISKINLTDDHWNEIMYYCKVTIPFIMYFKNKIDWVTNNILENANIILSEDVITELSDSINWNFRCCKNMISQNSTFSKKSFPQKCMDECTVHYPFSQAYSGAKTPTYKTRMHKFRYRDENYKCQNVCCRKFSKTFINSFIDKNLDSRLNWIGLTLCYRTDIEFIKEYSDYVDWYILSSYAYDHQELITEFTNRLNWGIVSQGLDPSVEFLRKYKTYLKWQCFEYHGNWTSYELLSEFEEYIEWDEMYEYYIEAYEYAKHNGIVDFDEDED